MKGVDKPAHIGRNDVGDKVESKHRQQKRALTVDVVNGFGRCCCCCLLLSWMSETISGCTGAVLLA